VATRCALFSALVRDERGAREEAVWRLRQLLPTALDLGHLHFVGQELALAPDLATDVLASSEDHVVARQLLEAVAATPRAVGVLAAALACGPDVACEALRVGADRLPPSDRETLLRRGRRHRLPAVRRTAADLQAASASTATIRDAFPELTKRETEVLELIAEGQRNAEIAKLLVLQPTTVKKYVNRIFSKLGVEDRVQATLRFHQHANRTNGRPPLTSGTDGKMRK
jgi:ATP/maltotriose-dependent transcriptional regulator MalT